MDLCQEKEQWIRYCEKNAGRISKEGQKVVYVFVDMEKAFDRVPRKVMVWAMRKNGSVRSNTVVQAVISLYDGVKTRVRVGSAYSEEF